VAAPLSRRLSTIRRHVALDRVDEYMVAWHALRAVASLVGAKAWLFRGAGHEDHFIEFLEWTSGELLDDPAIADALAALDAYAHGTVEEWEQAD
jgi:hypothetical protein